MSTLIDSSAARSLKVLDTNEVIVGLNPQGAISR